MYGEVLKELGKFGRIKVRCKGLTFEMNTGIKSAWNKRCWPVRWFNIDGQEYPLPRYHDGGFVSYYSWLYESMWVLHDRQINPRDLEMLPVDEQQLANDHCAKHWPTKRIVCHMDGTFDWWFPTNGWHRNQDHLFKNDLFWMPKRDQKRILRHFVKFGYWEHLTSICRQRFLAFEKFSQTRADEVFSTKWKIPSQWNNVEDEI